MSMLASLAVCVVLVQALVQPPSMTDDVLPLKGSAVQLSDADDASLNAPQSEAMEVAPALADNQSSSESGDGALSTVEDSMPTSRTVGGVTDEALAVDLSQFVMMVGVVMAALGMIASVRWLWQVRPTRR
jgi:hypothetical protein